MSDFGVAMSGGLDAIYARLGDAAVYQDLDGWCTECTVIQSRDLDQYGGAAEVGADAVIFSVRRSEVAERPRRGAIVEMSSTEEVFRVANVVESDEFEHRFIAA